MVQQYGAVGKGIIENNALLPVFLQHYSQQNFPIEVKLLSIKKMLPLKQPMMTILGWGRKKSYYRAKKFADKQQLPILTLEDGFLRSLDSGIASRFACSMVIDPIGIYFESKQPSYLEKLIIQQNLTGNEKNRAEMLIETIVAQRLSKYNSTAILGTIQHLPISSQQNHILLIDQVADDQSIAGANADKQTFAKMLKIAQNNHPNAQIWIKAHPASDKGYLTALKLPKNCQIIREKVNPIELLSVMDEVYTVSSHMGFEALMLGKKVHCFGLSWYAGWGLTDDKYIDKKNYEVVFARRGALKKPTLIELFDACYLRYSHYANPATGKSCEIDEVITWLVTNRAWKQQLPSYLTVFEMSRWKHSFIKKFVASTNMQLFFKFKPTFFNQWQQSKHRFDKNLPFLVWGFASKRQLIQRLLDIQSPEIWCMEDGFIRSNGLGANLIEPLSVVLDKTGIYYNAMQASDLEYLLQQKTLLTFDEQKRVENLIECLLNQQVSKYNVGKHTQLQINIKPNQRKILVVGQVEDDMSVQLCASAVKTNLDLLKNVYKKNPDAYIIYKPHPDVQAGLRTGKISDDDMAKYANQVVFDVSMPACLAVVDEVHTISSLTGFEGLLRGKSVTCYGLPFYAGWGLTTDLADNDVAKQTLQRRQRNTPLNLLQLVQTVLIDYPIYRLPNGYGLAQVEDVIDYLYPIQNVENSINKQQPLINKVKKIAKQKFMQGRHQLLGLLKHK